MLTIRRILSTVLVLLLAMVLVVTQTGCVAVAAAGAAAGGVGYVNGDLEGYINSPLPRIIASINAALVRMKYVKIKEESSGARATLTARTGDDTRITIHLEQVTEATCEITIRHGVFGDRQLSQVLMNEIRKGI